MEQHKVRTYILYAIGEIGLIVIGILQKCPVRDYLLVESIRLEPGNCAVGTTYE